MPKSLLFLWHMHQPNYEGKNGILQMPWVFLHCIKDYYDMPWLLSKYPSLKATFNVTPTLIRQIKIYEKEGYKKDKFLSLWIKDVTFLSVEEKKYLLKICKSAQYETMVKGLQRFDELYDIKEYSLDDFRDLEVVFLLSWCGNYLRENSSVVKKMIAKQRNFNEKDKNELLDELISFLPRILPFYKRLLKQKQISISTTPYNHPILPLLFDMKNAKLANPKTTLPKEYFSLKEDAFMQVDLAIELYEEIFAQKPSGFWPAEGAVDKESLKCYKDRGIKWVATDEEILYKSLKKEDKSLKYKRYEYDNIFIGFRDHYLSDLIGFAYRYKDEKEAADDFVDKVGKIKDDSSVFVILDGENAWEFYKNNAKDFFTGLYKKLSSSNEIKTLNFDETISLKKEKLPTLSPGSWIYGNFDTWVGHSEKNRAWELLYQTKRDTKDCKVDKEVSQKIKNHFLQAECSDWFWWYGEDHFSNFLSEFDKLFRSHLISIYNLCGLRPPSTLLLPVQKEREIKLTAVKPKFNLNVKIDGKKSSFYEWLGSGVVDESRIFGTMQGSSQVAEKLYYGENDKFIFLRIDGNIKKILNEYKWLKIHFKEINKIFEIPIKKSFYNNLIKMSIDDIIEIQIDKKVCQNLSKINIQIELEDKEKNSEFIPIYGDVQVCDNEYEKNWFI